uniref:Putative G-protein coupled receptor 133 n=1 Tax=Lygus hesperus TaxID=30085 RepID=A0A0A9VZD1_LYGHE
MTFRIPKIKSCCCFTLATGSKIIGFFQLLLFVTGLALSIHFRGNFHRAINVLQILVRETIFLEIGVLAFMLLSGAFKRDYVLVFPWILFQSIMMLIMLVSLVGNIAYLGLMDTRNHNMEVEFFISIYFFVTVLVVYNFYRDLRDQRPSEGI